jgi:hypothetical protein
MSNFGISNIGITVAAGFAGFGFMVVSFMGMVLSLGQRAAGSHQLPQSPDGDLYNTNHCALQQKYCSAQ